MSNRKGTARKVWRITIALACVLGTAACLTAEPLSKQKSTSAQRLQSTNGRYEIVQSPAGMRWTFLLDKQLGKVWIWVVTADGGNAWEPMTIQKPSTDENSVGSGNRFQISVSNAPRTTFLLDTMTGKSWQLETVTDDKGHEEDMWVNLPKG
jgi:hypothetical protein